MKDRSNLHQENLKNIFSPKSVAVVGATNDPGTVPYDILESLLKGKFNGPIYPVSPGQKEILGLATYKYVIDIEEPVDLAIIVFPSPVVHMALEQCGQKGIKSVIIISAGFREIGEKGIEREQKIIEIAEKYGISFVGPNCLGLINADPDVRINASFAREMPAHGNIGFLSQSGALCTAVLDYAQAKGIGFSKFVSFGNKADISEIDLMYYLMRDEATKVILLYLEEVRDGRGLMTAAQDIMAQSGKPVLIIKSGRTQEGASAAASHTGSLAGSDVVCSAAFSQAGMIRCDNIEEMFHIATAMAYQPLPVSDRVAIITNAGGPGVLTTDAVIRQGLRMAQFSEDTTHVLKRALPSVANLKNPVDVIGDATADRYDAAVRAVVDDPGVDGVLVILTPQSMTNIDDIAQGILKAAKDATKPIYASFMGEADVASGIKILQNGQIPHYTLPEAMSRSFFAAHQFRQRYEKIKSGPSDGLNKETKPAHEVIENARANGQDFLQEFEAVDVLKDYGLEALPGKLVNSESEAKEAAQEIGFPVVMKIQSKQVLHKTEAGGIITDVMSADAAADAYSQLVQNLNTYDPEASLQGVYVTRQVPQGVEVILGLKNDPSFGPVVMFGLGGTFVEIYNDVSFRVAPVSKEEAVEMIKEIKAFKILAGARGKVARDIESIARAISGVGDLGIQNSQVEELDINPLIVGPEGEGSHLADAKILLKKQTQETLSTVN